ncbi:MAG: DUF4129 domain-containing protein [Anaerolineaceae bacterium]
MKKDKRRLALLLILMTIICVIVLGISLPDLAFQPALPFPGAETNSVDIDTSQTAIGSPSLSFPWIFQLGLALGILLLFVALITALLKKANIKKVVLLAIILALGFALFSLLPNLPTSQVDPAPIDTYVPDRPQFDYLTAPIRDPPATLFFWVKVFLLLAISVLMGWFGIRVFRRNQRNNKLAAEAQSAILAISNRRDLGGIIIRCYINMEKVVSQERGIDRNQFTTPREFKTHLIYKGIPEEPILQLTTLFEKVRYGNLGLTEQDELVALNSLSSIQKACLSNKKGGQ